MKLSVILSTAVTALGLAFLLALPVEADTPGTLEGRLVNGTSGGGPVSGLEVTLRSPNPGAKTGRVAAWRRVTGLRRTIWR